jgi:hypothetical protein
MTHAQIARGMYSQTSKGKKIGMFQIGICPTIIFGLLYYFFKLLIFEDIDTEMVLSLGIFLTTFSMLGYALGPVYIPKRKMEKLVRYYFSI